MRHESFGEDFLQHGPRCGTYRGEDVRLLGSDRTFLSYYVKLL